MIKFQYYNQRFQEKGGCFLPPLITDDDLQDLKTMDHYKDDVWVVTYPRSGSTWTQQILKLIRAGGKQDNVKLSTSVPWLEAKSYFGINDLQAISRPRSFKSHFPYDKFPCGPPSSIPGKFIYVARNIKDVAASTFCYHHNFFSDMDWDTFWPVFLSGELGPCNYFDHVLSWWSHRNDDNVLFMKYEDMKKNPVGCISTMSSFIGADLSSEVVTKVAEMTAFDNMKDNSTANYEWRFKTTSHKFMRKGVVGDWKNFLTAEQSKLADKLYSERLQGAGLEMDFE